MRDFPNSRESDDGAPNLTEVGPQENGEKLGGKEAGESLSHGVGKGP